MPEMTDYETADLVFNLVGYGMTAMALYFTVISSYLVVAFMVGTQLSKSQVVIVSSLFGIFALILSFGTFSFFAGANGYGGEGGPIGFWLAPALCAAELGGIIAAFGFMLDIRRRSEK